jgi:hypothetical protein
MLTSVALFLFGPQARVKVAREIAKMFTPMNLKQKSKMPMGVFRSKPLKAPQHLFQVISDVQDVVFGVADHRLGWNLIGVGDTVVAKIREPCTDVGVCHHAVPGWALIACLRFT